MAKPFEHPHDKRPCVVCGAAPLVLRGSQHPDVGSCLRCRAPYFFKEPGQHGDLLPQVAFAEPNLREIAIAAWAESIKIEFAPYASSDPTASTAFEEFVERHEVEQQRPGELHDASIPVEVWTVSGEPGDERFLRILPLIEPGELDASTEWGSLLLEASGLPHGTTITIVRPIS